jgi:hypothetical protein
MKRYGDFRDNWPDFWDKWEVNTETGCWEWLKSLDYNGYPVNAQHRVAYVVAGNHIPRGHQVDHLCSNKRCGNPTHLEAVTPTINTRRAFGITDTHFGCGHPQSSWNTYIRPNKPTPCCRYCRYLYAATRHSNSGKRHTPKSFEEWSVRYE